MLAEATAIEWTDVTWSPVTGCTKVSTGCNNCNAERIAEQFQDLRAHPYEQGFDPRLRSQRLDNSVEVKANDGGNSGFAGVQKG